jgi:predicted DNA-binding ribbon-helix-helix protein
MKSMIAKRSIMINNHKTSVSLEDEFWSALKEIAQQRNQKLSALIAFIDSERTTGNLSSALRLFVLDQYRSNTGAVRQAVSTAA